MQERSTVIFVIDPPVLYVEAVLLVASIRRNLTNVDITAYCPAEKLIYLLPQVREFLEAQGVTLAAINTKNVFFPNYPHGNKILASASERKTRKTLFLDTDTFIYRPFDLDLLFAPKTISVAPEGRLTWGDPEKQQNWPYLYRKFRLREPEHMIRLARTGEVSYPYFNAGVIAFENGEAQNQLFEQTWLEISSQIDRDESVPDRRPWLDQIALPIAATQSEMAFNILPIEWNFSLSRKAGNTERIRYIDLMRPYIVHYHNFKYIYETKFLDYVDNLIRDFTVFNSLDELNAPILDQRSRVARIERKMKEIRGTRGKDRTMSEKLELSKLKPTFSK